MKKEITLILASLLVVALVISVKIVETYAVAHSQVSHGNLLACDDPPPPPAGGG